MKEGLEKAIELCNEVAKDNENKKLKNYPQDTAIKKVEYGQYKSAQVTAEYIADRLKGLLASVPADRRNKN